MALFYYYYYYYCCCCCCCFGPWDFFTWFFLEVWRRVGLPQYPVSFKVLYTHMHMPAETYWTQYRRAKTQFFRKIYFSLYLKGLCVRGSWRPNRIATYWPPLLWPSEFLSCSPGLLNQRPGDPALCWVLFSLQHHFSISLISKLLNRGHEGSLFRVLAFSTTSCLQTPWISCALSYIIVQRPLNISS